MYTFHMAKEAMHFKFIVLNISVLYVYANLRIDMTFQIFSGEGVTET